MNTKFIQSPFVKPRGNNILDTIIIHHIGSNKGKIYSVGGTITWFTDEEVHRNKDTGKLENLVSAHYIIPREPFKGSDLIQLAGHDQITYHAGKSTWVYKNGVKRSYLNKNSIGIEIAGDGNFVPYTDFQYEVLIELLKNIMEECSIPLENILGHEDIAPGRKVDPGKLFDWERVRAALAEPAKVDHITEAVQEVMPLPDHKPAPKPVKVAKDSDFHMESGADDNSTMQALVGIANFIRKVIYFLLNPNK